MSEERRSLSEHFQIGLAKYSKNWRSDVLASAAVFVPMGIINFRFVRLQWRTPFISVFGLIFPVVVSWQRGAHKSIGHE
eukprot:SAG31_NODE_2977_length_4833_cov_5.035488_2_plen_79_part_00